MNKLALLAMILTGAMTAAANADIVVRVQVFHEAEDADPQAVPQGEASMTLETQATAAGRFLSRTRLGKQTIELKGNVKHGDDGTDRVSITFTEQAPGEQRQLSTSLMLKPDQPHVVGKAGDRKVVLTILKAEDERA